MYGQICWLNFTTLPYHFTGYKLPIIISFLELKHNEQCNISAIKVNWLYKIESLTILESSSFQDCACFVLLLQKLHTIVENNINEINNYKLDLSN